MFGPFQKTSKVKKSDAAQCNVLAVIASMREEQKEHHYSKISEAYLKVSSLTKSTGFDEL